MPSSPATRNEPPDLPRMLAQASTLQRQGQIVEAERLYLAVLAIVPDNADALHSMGNLKLARGEPGEALRLIGAAMAARAPTPRILFDLGLAFNALNQHQKALDSFDLAIQLQPDFFEAHGNRGAMLAALGRHDDAIASYRNALAIRPDFADAHCNLGSALTRLQRYDDALASLDRAIALRADYADALYNRGNALKPLQRYQEALASYDRAIALWPGHADAHNNRGQVLRELERYDEALASYDRALALRPKHVMAHCNAAALRLLTGDFERGWAHYEWRWLKKSVMPTRRNFSQPAWNGRDPIAGKTILIHSEQGLGDAIQFCRYVPLLAARGVQVIFEVQKPLQTLMGSLDGAAQVVPKGGPLPAFDLHCPLVSLPLAFGTRLKTIPSTTGYLSAPAQHVTAWQSCLEGKPHPRIGLVWSGNPGHERDRERSIGLRTFVPLLDAFGDDVTFFSLQKDVRPDDDAFLKERTDILDNALEDFSDTAALISQLDLVISVDTSVAHLAGALGKPVWILLTYFPDWRWLLGRDDSPWYPSARLFRQDESRTWDGVVARVCRALREFT
ncbi:MAG: tetratricopeptide repeat-containing glycosyltransferase family protein [Pseudolabrys sp.]